MSSPIPPPQGLEGVIATQAPHTAAGSGQPEAATAATVIQGPSVQVDTIPSSPPAEVLQQITAAGRAYERLRAAGQEVHFSEGADGGLARAEIRDLKTGAVRTLSAAEALELAAGEQPR